MRSWQFRQHYPEGTLSVPVWCGTCQAETQHRVQGHKLTHICIPCQERAEADHKQKSGVPAPIEPRQQQFAITTFLDWETGRVHA